jgi:hypothetical protein
MGQIYSTGGNFIQITLINKNKHVDIEGFVAENNYSLTYSIHKNSTVEELLSLVNVFRVQTIKTLYDNEHICKKNDVLTRPTTLFVSMDQLS